MSHECPQCGYIMEDIGEEICPKCNFNFNDLLTCPYKISNRCIYNQKECDINGLNYEDCKLYLHKAGIKIKD